jgi:diguanylate cyclase (GGDEF)-like protein
MPGQMLDDNPPVRLLRQTWSGSSAGNSEERFRSANQFAATARRTVSLTIACLLLLLNTVLSLHLSLTPLLLICLFEAAVNQPLPQIRRGTGTEQRLYVLNASFDILAATAAAYLLGGLANPFVVIIYLLIIALVGVAAGRLLAYWTAFLSSAGLVALAALGSRGSVPAITPALTRIGQSDRALSATIQAFSFVMMAFFVSIPPANLRKEIERREELEQKLRTREIELSRGAFYDLLTGLPNRALFLQRLTEAIDTSAQAAGLVALLFLDLDRFKQVNDTLGHTAGDALLVALATRLRTSVPVDDLVARLAGDEFTILFYDVESAAEATERAEALLEAINRPFDLEGQEILTTASIGVALTTPGDPGLRPTDILRRADIALHRAKAAGRTCVAVFDADMHRHIEYRRELEGDLRHALNREELRLFYQPIVEMPTGRLIGVEALARWLHPTRGLLAPTEFIGLAEEMGLARPIGAWVLRQACHQLQLWNRQRIGRPPLIVSVNLFPGQFQQPDLVEQVEGELARTGLPPDCLELDIGQDTMVRDAEAAVRSIERLKELGVRLAIDDFGSGYSSLECARRSRVDTLKIDRSLVGDLGRDEVTASIVRSVTMIAHAIDSRVTIVGIENEDQLQSARELGCDHYQGFYFSPPLPPEEVSLMLTSRDAGTGLAVAVPDSNARDIAGLLQPAD